MKTYSIITLLISLLGWLLIDRIPEVFFWIVIVNILSYMVIMSIYVVRKAV